MVFIEGCKDPKSVSILIRAGLERMVNEAERATHNALSFLCCLVYAYLDLPRNYLYLFPSEHALIFTHHLSKKQKQSLEY